MATRLRLGIVLSFVLLTVSCRTAAVHPPTTPEEIARFAALPLPPASMTTDIKQAGVPVVKTDITLMDVSDGPLPSAGWPVVAATINPDDVFLYIRLNRPPESAAAGTCWFDHKGEPPIDDDLVVFAQHPGATQNTKLLHTTYKDVNDHEGAIFQFRMRDLPGPGTYIIDVAHLNAGGNAHAFYTYCIPGYCGEFRRCNDNCGNWGWCKNQQFTVVKQ